MYKTAVVFAGTIEGRRIARYLAQNHVQTWVSVATEYGESLYEPEADMKISSRRMNGEEMCAYLKEADPAVVIDATHPYAKDVTTNIKDACAKTGYPYLRLLREESQSTQAVYVESIEEAVEYLEHTSGNILLTTGSKELAGFTKLTAYQERVYARVLSLPNVVEACAQLGFEGKHLICMQGPFSYEMNRAMMQQIQGEILVTKESGKAGGFMEKYEAAISLGKKVLIIGRPTREEGLSFHECKRKVQELFALKAKQDVTLVGIGMGTENTMTADAIHAMEQAQLLIGAKRMVEAIEEKAPWADQLYEYDAEKIRNYVETHPEYEKVVVALSGDVGFYSGAKKLMEQFQGWKVKLVPGIASLIYFCSQIPTSWDDVKVASLHGRQDNVIGMIKKYPKVFVLAGTKDGVGKLCEKLEYYHMENVSVTIGECLSYENEKISRGYPKEFAGKQTDPLCVMLIENLEAKASKVAAGICDEAFIRGKVPMTKEEIRSISISKLGLTRESVVYDIGAGTGSVSIEIVQHLENGCVYAIEKNPDAIALLHENKRKFAADNLSIIEGLAPEALEELPIPSHAFIGGSSGNLKEILTLLLKKNPSIRMVINAITLETVAETLDCLKCFPFKDVDIAAVSVAKSKQAGRYHLMMGQNPVYVVSCTGENKI